ncbi:hypothetical protein [Galactobacter valiniphilus]|uniref:hypothetical protein n=1 Tax=Galactobacter valiniphilus TaxID=2676122 RepID=UPI003736BD00
MTDLNERPLFTVGPEGSPSAPGHGPVPRAVHERIVDELETRVREANETAEH